MNASSLKLVVLKEALIVVVCLLLGLVGTAYAGGEGEKAKKAISKAQTELFAELDAEYQADLEKILDEIEHPKPQFDSVEVYSYSGELLKTISLADGHEFNSQEMLPHAHLLTIDDRTAVYVVFE